MRAVVLPVFVMTQSARFAVGEAKRSPGGGNQPRSFGTDQGIGAALGGLSSRLCGLRLFRNLPQRLAGSSNAEETGNH